MHAACKQSKQAVSTYLRASVLDLGSETEPLIYYI